MVNEVGELIEVPISPNMAAWLLMLEQKDFFNENHYTFGSDNGDLPLNLDGSIIWVDPPESNCTQLRATGSWQTDFYVHEGGDFGIPSADYWYRKWIDAPASQYISVDGFPPPSDPHLLVGIGTCNPQRTLHVAGSSIFEENVKFESAIDGSLGIGTSDPQRTLHVAGDAVVESQFIIDRPDSDEWEYGLDIRIGDDKTKAISVRNMNDDEEHFRVWGNGKVGAREVEVTLGEFTPPDYVFDPDYELMPLPELSSYLNENRSLPYIPTGEEMLENGIALGEMQLGLLKHLEELTLHVIALEAENRELKKLEKRLEEKERQLKRIDELEERLNMLEKNSR
jgi:hypothetical protein